MFKYHCIRDEAEIKALWTTTKELLAKLRHSGMLLAGIHFPGSGCHNNSIS